MNSDLAGSFVLVRTPNGDLRGRVEDGVCCFLGIAYGEDTSRRRFRPAEPARSWSGLRDALEFGDQCLQPPSPDVELLSAGWNHPSAGSENCLNLNLWTPAIGDGGRRPVMVNMHGGGWTVGSGNSAGRSGASFAGRHDIVRVNVNHRLGLFGYSNMAGRLGPDYADSGTVGIQDIVLALRWVRDNIAAFGGDPDNVTIFGVSGGGAKVSTLMAMPAAKGLFHRASVESGPMLTAVPSEAAASAAERLLAALDIRPEEAESVLSLTGEQLLAGYMRLHPDGGLLTAGFGPVVGGESLPRHPFEPSAPEESSDVPLLIGTTATEMSIFAELIGGPAFDLTWEGLDQRLSSAPMPGLTLPAATVISEMRRSMPEATPAKVLFALATEAVFRRGTIIQAERAARRPAPVYMWLITWETPVDGGKWGSPHGLSVPLIMDTVLNVRSMFGPDLSEPLELSDIMSSAWARFARTGVPSDPRIPRWPPYDADRRETMVFDTGCHVVSDRCRNSGGCSSPNKA